MPCIQGMPSGKSDTLGMVRPVPCGQAIPGMLQDKLGLPIIPTCLVLTDLNDVKVPRSNIHFLSSVCISSNHRNNCQWLVALEQEQQHREGKEAKVTTGHLPVESGPWGTGAAHPWG